MELRATLGISRPAGFIRAITAALVVFVAGAVLLTSGRGGSPTATHRSRAAALPVMPWGVMKNSWSEGAYSLYVDNPTHHNGALSLNAKSGSTCKSTSGAADYKNEIIGPPNGSVVCDVSLGDVLPVKTGQNAGPTAQGIDKRITSWDSLSAIVQCTTNGHQANILKPNSPQLVLLPVVEDMSGYGTWPSGSGTVRVIGFAYFVLTQPGYTNGGKTVLGRIVGLQVNDRHVVDRKALFCGRSR